MTVKEYLQTRRITDTPRDDFTRDARSDKRMPDVKSWAELRAYLERRAGSSIRDAVLEAGYGVWRDYLLALAKELKRA